MEKKEIVICIDVQKDYANYFSYSYLKKLLDYLNKRWREGVEIVSLFEPVVDWDKASLTLADVPTQILELSSKAGYKLYESSLAKRLNEEFSVVGIINEPTRSIVAETEKPKLWFENQKFIYLAPILEDLLTHDNELVKYTLVGGGLSKCVSITYRLLKEYGFDVVIQEDMCYEIRHVFNSNRKENAFFKKPTRLPAKYLQDGEVPMSKLKRDDFLDFIARKLREGPYMKEATA